MRQWSEWIRHFFTLMLCTASGHSGENSEHVLPVEVIEEGRDLLQRTESEQNSRGNRFSGSAFDPALPLGLDGRIAFHSSALWAPARATDIDGDSLGYVRQNAGVSFPIWIGDGQSLFGSLGIQNLLFQTDVVLPDSGKAFPDNLWDIRGTLVYATRFDNDWRTTLIGSLGSTGDRPFAGSRELIPGVTGVLSIPMRDRDAWLLSLSYQPVTGLPFPVPGVAYLWEPSDRVTAQIGIPFRLCWMLNEDLRFDASYLPVTNARAYVTYAMSERIELFGGFDWVSESYLLYDRVDSDDFFNLLEKRLPIGVRWKVGSNWVLDLQVGYLFDRMFFSGESILNEGSDVVDVSPGAFGMLRLLYRF